MSYKYTFTVFTSAYNRASTLHRVYESLKKQTFRDFEWVIADNGSGDNVKDIVHEWIKEADFPIQFLSWEKNVWWHGAFNRGVQAAQGELFFNFDSDDSCIPTALECFKKNWDLIPNDSKEKFSGMGCLCIDQHGNPVGTRFPSKILDSTLPEIKYKYHVKGEKKGFHKTDVLKQYPFPQFDGPFPPGVLWSRINRKFNTRFINEPLVVWHINEAGRTDQWTFHTKLKQAGPSLSLLHGEILNHEIRWFRYSPKEFLRSAVHFVRFSLHAEIGFAEQFKILTNPLAKFLWIMMLPIGALVYLKEKKRDRPNG